MSSIVENEAEVSVIVRRRQSYMQQAIFQNSQRRRALLNPDSKKHSTFVEDNFQHLDSLSLSPATRNQFNGRKIPCRNDFSADRGMLPRVRRLIPTDIAEAEP